MNEMLPPAVCDCPSCQAPFSNASGVVDEDGGARLSFNIPLGELRQTVNLRGEPRIHIEFDVESGALDELKQLVNAAHEAIHLALLERQMQM